MKKILLLLSITLVTVWIIGFFILKLPTSIHIVLVLSILAYIRSLMAIDNSAPQKNYNGRKNDSLPARKFDDNQAME